MWNTFNKYYILSCLYSQFFTLFKCQGCYLYIAVLYLIHELMNYKLIKTH